MTDSYTIDIDDDDEYRHVKSQLGFTRLSDLILRDVDNDNSLSSEAYMDSIKDVIDAALTIIAEEKDDAGEATIELFAHILPGVATRNNDIVICRICDSNEICAIAFLRYSRIKCRRNYESLQTQFHLFHSQNDDYDGYVMEALEEECQNYLSQEQPRPSLIQRLTGAIG